MSLARVTKVSLKRWTVVGSVISMNNLNGVQVVQGENSRAEQTNQVKPDTILPFQLTVEVMMQMKHCDSALDN